MRWRRRAGRTWPGPRGRRLRARRAGVPAAADSSGPSDRRTSVRIMELSPSDKGAIAEAEITAAAVRLGVVVARPLSEGRRYDLILDTGPRLLRVQCKWARHQESVISCKLATSRHTPTNGYVVTTYSTSEIDALALYCAELDRCFLIPIARASGLTYIHLRTAPARNNQRQLINLAEDFDLATMLASDGAIAQLGERVAGSQEVVGSSPTSSTSMRPRIIARPLVVPGRGSRPRALVNPQAAAADRHLSRARAGAVCWARRDDRCPRRRRRCARDDRAVPRGVRALIDDVTRAGRGRDRRAARPGHPPPRRRRSGHDAGRSPTRGELRGERAHAAGHVADRPGPVACRAARGGDRLRAVLRPRGPFPGRPAAHLPHRPGGAHAHPAPRARVASAGRRSCSPPSTRRRRSCSPTTTPSWAGSRRSIGREREAAARTTVARRRRTLAGVLAGEPMDPGDAGDRLGYDMRRHHLGLRPVGRQRSTASRTRQPRIARALDAGAAAHRAARRPALAAWFGSVEPPDAGSRGLGPRPRGAPGPDRRRARPRPGIDGFRTTHSEALAASRTAMDCRSPNPR